MRALCALPWLIAISVWSGCPAGGDDSKRLREAGVEPTVDGVRKYLTALLPSAEQTAHAQRLIARLGSADFREREQAARELAALGNPPVELLKRAAESKDVETRWRARAVLKRVRSGNRQARMSLVLRFIAERKLPGLTGDLLNAIPTIEDRYLFKFAAEALSATVQAKDVGLLRAAIAGDVESKRVPAIVAFSVLQRDAARPELRRLLADRVPAVQLEACRQLLKLSDRSALGPLVKLLSAEELNVRSDAIAMLRAISGRNFGYVAYQPDEKRQAAERKWDDWIKMQATVAKLKLPLKVESVYLGRTLICVFSGRSVFEIDRSGKKTFEVAGFKYNWGCWGTPRGHRLVADFGARSVIEYDVAGNEVWRKAGLPGGPTSVERLPNGNTLLACTDSGDVLEVDRAGNLDWKIKLAGRPTTAQRLPNGNTLVNLQFGKRVVEVDRTGRVVWEVTGTNNAYTAEQTPGGNVLVCEMGLSKVVEYNRAGKVVWSHGGFKNPAQASRLSNGNTLVADENGLHEIDPSGKEVWQYKVGRARFCRY